MGTDPVYAPSREVTSLEDCLFYHTVDIPGFGHVDGRWDLRPGIDDYLGHYDFAGKRVLELGTADGFITFHMERIGAQVVSHDVSADHQWDFVPYARHHPAKLIEEFREGLPRLHNAYWLSHRAFRSQAKMVYGDVYSVPEEIGPVDISTFGSILLHVRDPFRALATSLRLTREAVIVTEMLGRYALAGNVRRLRRLLPRRARKPSLRFLPEWQTGADAVAWWRLSPELVQALLGVLGFERTEVTFHRQLFDGRPQRLFTVIGYRTVGTAGPL